MADEFALPLARITPTQRAVALPQTTALAPTGPSPREKAAIIVRLLLAEGVALPVGKLPEHMQASLTEQMAKMRLVDRATLARVVDEFVSELEAVGLSFPGGIDSAISLMDGHISASAASRLRRLAGASGKADPWDRINALPNDRLLLVLTTEGIEVCAVMLSKLPVAKAAELLGKLDGDRARRIAYAVSQTADVDPETVRRIGLSLAQQLEAQPPKAFETGPVERVGAILNVSPGVTRDQVLEGLEAEDADFAERVRRAIFTFAHIPARIAPRDVPKIVRMVDQPTMITALTACLTDEKTAPVMEFLLSNMSQRLAQSLREEVEARGKVKEKEGEEAMSTVVSIIRELENAGEITLQREEEEG